MNKAYNLACSSAKGPFLNPIEMGLTSLEDVVAVIMHSRSRTLFLKIFGKELTHKSGLNVSVVYNKIADTIVSNDLCYRSFLKYTSHYLAGRGEFSST